MRINRKFRLNIFQSLCFVKLSELFLYIGVHSVHKKKFIERILALQTSTQTALMTIIDDLAESIYTTDLTEVLEKIDSLEIENERLEEEISQKSIKYEELE